MTQNDFLDQQTWNKIQREASPQKNSEMVFNFVAKHRCAAQKCEENIHSLSRKACINHYSLLWSGTKSLWNQSSHFYLNQKKSINHSSCFNQFHFKRWFSCISTKYCNIFCLCVLFRPFFFWTLLGDINRHHLSFSVLLMQTFSCRTMLVHIRHYS